MKFFKIECWDYMDASPRTEVRAFADKATAQKFADHMQQYYSGGTTRLLGEMSKEEAKAHCLQQYKKELGNPQEDTYEFLEKVNSLFKECYGEDAFIV